MIDHYLTNAILCEVAKDSGISAEILRGQSRKREVTKARYLVICAGWHAGMSASGMARLLDKCHTTILHGQRRFFDLHLEDAGLSILNKAMARADAMRAAAYGPYVNEGKTKRAIKSLTPVWNGEAA